MIRVLLCDDHALMREGVKALLVREPDIEVVGEASDGLAAIREAERLKPDVILMDVAMPGLGGLEATLELRTRLPSARILVLTQYDDREYVHRFLRAGAAGYLLKKAVGGELLTAIRAVASGQSFLYPPIAAQVLEDYVLQKTRGDGDARPGEDPYERLTAREKQVLKLIAEGNTSRKIGELLCISVKTVMGHRTNLMEKLDVHNQTELVRFAVAKGLIRVD